MNNLSAFVIYSNKLCDVNFIIPTDKSRTCEFKSGRKDGVLTGNSVKLAMIVPIEFILPNIISKFSLIINKKAPTSNAQIAVGEAPTKTWAFLPKSYHRKTTCDASNRPIYVTFYIELRIRFAGRYNLVLNLRDIMNNIEFQFKSNDFLLESTSSEGKTTKSETNRSQQLTKNISIPATKTSGICEHKQRKRSFEGATDEDRPNKKAKTTRTPSKNCKKSVPSSERLEYALNCTPNSWANETNLNENFTCEANPCDSNSSSPLSSQDSPNSQNSDSNSNGSELMCENEYFNSIDTLKYSNRSENEYFNSIDLNSNCRHQSGYCLDYELMSYFPMMDLTHIPF